jgi:hypothetical protein
MEATVYNKLRTEQLHQVECNQRLPMGQYSEVRIVRCGGAKRTIFDFNPLENDDPELTLWMWGEDWISDLEWDPKEWRWRRIGALPDTTILNYCTKRGYRAALQQNNHKMKVDEELEEAGYNSKARARFFNRIWHPYLPRKVSAMQWLILTEGLPVGAWRERLGLPNNCQLCPTQDKETLQHAFQDCSEIRRVWELFRKTRSVAGLPPSYNTWKEISRGLMTDSPGPSIEESLRWDTAAAFSVTTDTPWDILRAQLLWTIWCQRVEIAFREDHFHLGVVLWLAWKNTIYCGMEAYKELFRHKQNEEKRQEMISCFQTVWTKAEIFGRMRGGELKWNLTPHTEFLPVELGAWTVPPIRINRLSPSPDPEMEFTARTDFPDLIDAFIQSINIPPDSPEETHLRGVANDNQGDSTLHTPTTSEGREHYLPHSGSQNTAQPANPPLGTLAGNDTHRQYSAETNGEKENHFPGTSTGPRKRATSRPKHKCFKKCTDAHTRNPLVPRFDFDTASNLNPEVHVDINARKRPAVEA